MDNKPRLKDIKDLIALRALELLQHKNIYGYEGERGLMRDIDELEKAIKLWEPSLRDADKLETKLKSKGLLS